MVDLSGFLRVVRIYFCHDAPPFDKTRALELGIFFSDYAIRGSGQQWAMIPAGMDFALLLQATVISLRWRDTGCHDAHGSEGQHLLEKG